jgi:rhodanese-related sulfurtransferase
MVRFISAFVAVLALAGPLPGQEAQPPTSQRIPMAEFRKLHADNKVLVIDVRDAQSFAIGHIPRARSIPLGSLLAPAHVAELRAARDPIVLYCA